MLIGNCEHCRSNGENLRLPIEIQLSKKPQTFCNLFFAFLVSIWNFQSSEKKKKKKKKKMNEPHKSSISEFIDSEICFYLNA